MVKFRSPKKKSPKNKRKTDPRVDGKPNRKASRAPAPLPPATLTALIGATGGVGTTSAACALAMSLAARAAVGRTQMQRMTDGPRVALIDMDFQTGACAHHLDLLPTISAEDLSRPAAQIDASVVSVMAHQTVGGVALLSAPNGTDGIVSPRTVLALLDAATQLFDHIVIDLPRRFEPWTSSVLAGADVSAIMAELSVPSLHMARLRRAQLAPALGQMGRALETVITKHERRGGRGSLDLRDVQTALGEPAFHSLPMDPEPLRAAINSGEPLISLKPDCRYALAIEQLADKICLAVAAAHPDASLDASLDPREEPHATAQRSAA